MQIASPNGNPAVLTHLDETAWQRLEALADEVIPMPAHERDLQGKVLGAAADTLGWTVRAVPLAINSRDYDGRGPCSKNNLGVGFACPANARGGCQNTMISMAMTSGVFTLATQLRVQRVLSDGQSRVRGIQVTAADGRTREITADIGVVSSRALGPGEQTLDGACMPTVARRP